MSKPLSPPDVFRKIQEMEDKIKRLEGFVVSGPTILPSVPSQGDLPNANESMGMLYLVRGNAAGSRFQASDGTSWVGLG